MTGGYGSPRALRIVRLLAATIVACTMCAPVEPPPDDLEEILGRFRLAFDEADAGHLEGRAGGVHRRAVTALGGEMGGHHLEAAEAPRPHHRRLEVDRVVGELAGPVTAAQDQRDASLNG